MSQIPTDFAYLLLAVVTMAGRVVLALFAVYRLSFMLREDDGPLFLFERLRRYTDRKRKEEQECTRHRLGLAEDDVLIDTAELGTWASLDEGIRCPYCVGIWAALLLAFLVLRPTLAGDLFLLWLGLAGAQALLEAVTER
jgi:hypothetical protein